MADYYDDGLPGDTDEPDDREPSQNTAGPTSPWERCPVCGELCPMQWRSHECEVDDD
jgi:hypothetical protein